MKRSFLLCWLALAVCCSPQMFAQVAQPKDPCQAMPPAGTPAAKGFLTFDQFDRELRVDIAKEDPVALSFLVRFPLRVNQSEGSVSLDDAAALKAHFQEVFTPAIRKAILSDTEARDGCRTEGLMYGPGVIWVEASDRGYAIFVVNPEPPPSPAPKQNGYRIEFACQTPAYRIVIDTSPAGALRYRSWKKPKSVTEPPDLEIANGVPTFEGTNVCAIPIYTFKNGGAVYTVDGGMGCDAERDTPKDATGSVDVQVGGKAVMSSICY